MTYSTKSRGTQAGMQRVRGGAGGEVAGWRGVGARIVFLVLCLFKWTSKH